MIVLFIKSTAFLFKENVPISRGYKGNISQLCRELYLLQVSAPIRLTGAVPMRPDCILCCFSCSSNRRKSPVLRSNARIRTQTSTYSPNKVKKYLSVLVPAHTLRSHIFFHDPSSLLRDVYFLAGSLADPVQLCPLKKRSSLFFLRREFGRDHSLPCGGRDGGQKKHEATNGAALRMHGRASQCRSFPPRSVSVRGYHFFRGTRTIRCHKSVLWVFMNFYRCWSHPPNISNTYSISIQDCIRTPGGKQVPPAAWNEGASCRIEHGATLHEIGPSGLKLLLILGVGCCCCRHACIIVVGASTQGG